MKLGLRLLAASQGVQQKGCRLVCRSQHLCAFFGVRQTAQPQHTNHAVSVELFSVVQSTVSAGKQLTDFSRFQHGIGGVQLQYAVFIRKRIALLGTDFLHACADALQERIADFQLDVHGFVFHECSSFLIECVYNCPCCGQMMLVWAK